jgi:protein TonB
MFEDSTFASAGTISTGSPKWMVATFAFNSTVLLAMILIPLLVPQALPRMANSFLMALPQLKLAEPKPIVVPKDAVVVHTSAFTASITAPTRIPDKIFMADRKEIGVPINLATMEAENGISLPGVPEFHHPRVVAEAAKGPVRVSGMVVEGMLIRKTVPVYPPIAKAVRAEGTVVLGAVIARDGTIQNLHVISGHPMLQQAALDAVRTWRYRPYLLSGEPVEVETTINVIFKLS